MSRVGPGTSRQIFRQRLTKRPIARCGKGRAAVGHRRLDSWPTRPHWKVGGTMTVRQTTRTSCKSSRDTCTTLCEQQGIPGRAGCQPVLSLQVVGGIFERFDPNRIRSHVYYHSTHLQATRSTS